MKERKRTRSCWAIVVLGVTLIVGCSQENHSSTAGDMAESRDVGLSANASGAPAGAPAAAPAANTLAEPPKQITYSASISIAVEDVERADVRAREFVTSKGGLLARQDAHQGEGNSSQLQFKVAPELLTETLDEFDRLGNTTSRSVWSDDLSAQIADLDVRIQATEASVARVRDLIAKAGSVGEIAVVEGELTRRETELETMKAQKRANAERVSFATITLSLDTIKSEPTDTSGGVLNGIPGIGESLAAGFRFLQVATKGFGAAIGYAGPTALVLWLLWFAVTRLRRKVGRASVG